MTMLVRKGGGWQTITGAYVFANAAWRQLVAIQVYANGAWRKVANFTAPTGGGGGGGGTLSLSLSTTSLSGFDTTSSITTRTSVTVTPSGGLAPYSYAWSIVTPDPFATSTINVPNAATTNVTASGMGTGQTAECTIHCVVTDSLGTAATSDLVTCDFTNSL